MGPAFDLGFCAVWGDTSAGLPGVSQGELMREFTVEVDVWWSIKGREGSESPRHPVTGLPRAL